VYSIVGELRKPYKTSPVKPDDKIHQQDPEVKGSSVYCIEVCQDRFQGQAFVNTVMNCCCIPSVMVEVRYAGVDRAAGY
jgi:hypothetical protein